MQAVVRDGNLEVTANAELGKLSIFAVNGRLMAVSKENGTSATVDISSLPAGVYVANAHNKSVRFIKR